ncbi:MAG TPA: hypothetical protein VLM89_15060 [Phycisphaerae bacterium]|nr:hypothetical protein [Phycisphaerae bacterium]
MATTRIPIALLASMIIAAVTLGVIVIIWNLYPQLGGLEMVSHCAAAMCFAWVVAGHVLGHRRPDLSSRPVGRDLQAVLQMAAIVLGLVVVIVMTYVAATAALRRMPYLIDYEARWETHVWPTGLFDLGLVAAATILAWGRTRDNQLFTVCFWILVLAGLWLSMQLPLLREVPIDSGGSYPDTTRWTIPFMFAIAALIAAFSSLEGGVFRHRRTHAWPHALDRLTSPPPAWPGFHYSVGIIGVVTLILTCINISSAWATISAFVAGIAVLAMVGRRWEENLADLGVGLMSLGIASLPLLTVPTPEHLTSAWYANVFGRLVAGLALAAGFWHWLGGVWDQQLDDGRAWTTAGRLISNIRRAGFLCGATGVLVSLQLAFWPRFQGVDTSDNTAARWAWGVGAIVLLMLSLTFSARRTQKTTLAWLATFCVVALVSFVLIRLGDHALPQWWNSHWPLGLAGLSAASTLLAVAAYRHGRWRPFGEPLLLFGVLIGPVCALAGISLSSMQTMPTWVPAATFGALACTYCVAAIRPGPRSYAIACVICGAMAVYRLLQLTGRATL